MKNKKIKKNKEKGFLILIAVMVSMILLSIGLFIATISVREIALSSSVKDSQRAFEAADAATECAMYKMFKESGLPKSKLQDHNIQNAIKCNGYIFDWFDSVIERIENNDGTSYEVAKHIYYISFGKPTDANDDNLINKQEIDNKGDHWTIKKYPYVKLIINVPTSGTSNKTVIQAYGHNVYDGSVVVERALETKW